MSDVEAIRLEMVAVPCPLCGGGKWNEVCHIVDSTYGVPGCFHVVRCIQCRHIFLNPRPSDASLMDCYPQNYAPHQDVLTPGQVLNSGEAGNAEAELAATTDDAPPRRIRCRLKRIPGLRAVLNWLGQEYAIVLPPSPEPGVSRMLEIGCAHGAYLKAAEDAGWQVEGVEPSSEAVAIARAKGLRVVCGRLEDAEVGQAGRDLVAMWMVLEHVPNPRELLERIARILKPGGQLALSVPNAGSWERLLFGRHWLGYDAPRHLQMFTVGRLKRLLAECGFVDVRVIHQANTRYWWGSIAAWGLSMFPRSRWPRRWMGYFRGEPPAYWKWFLMVPGKLNAFVRCSGRVTIIARR
jgi:SAM-dependent methyltransferase